MLKKIKVTGKVQGVCYRAWTYDTAQILNLHGWVRNNPDGSVEAVLEGREDAISEIVCKMENGPPLAVVNSVEVIEVDGEESFSDFQIRR